MSNHSYLLCECRQGTLGISLPASTVYSIYSHSLVISSDEFRIRLKIIRNSTFKLDPIMSEFSRIWTFIPFWTKFDSFKHKNDLLNLSNMKFDLNRKLKFDRQIWSNVEFLRFEFEKTKLEWIWTNSFELNWYPFHGLDIKVEK